MYLASVRLRKFSQLALLFSLVGAIAAAAAPAPAEVMQRVFAWQVAHPWSAQQTNDRHGTRGWVQGAFLVGVMEAYRATGDTRYRDHAQQIAEGNDWQLGPRWQHADDHVVGQTYLELHAEAPAPEKLAATQAGMERVVADPTPGRKVWWWCDALFMAPPTLAKLARTTGDDRYLATMDRMYWDCHDALYDPAEQLFYRDDRFVFPKEGPKIFWSRGNGWVLAGLARLLDVLPREDARRARYEELFRQMAARVVALQPEDGLWRTNLLHPEAVHGEASGSGFFCYALAWGINQGLLTGPEYRRAVDRAWTGLVGCVAEDGMLGWVQPIGAEPGAFDASTWQEYGSGAFLAAGSQVMQLPAQQ